tara:strand:- start:362 stop:562 length:201 start_codon:yes stop_codon:yes gene_type:complete
VITVIVQLLLAFPKLGRLFFAIKNEYEKEIRSRRHNKHTDDIDDWVRNGSPKQSANIPPKTEQPRL